MQMVGFIQFVCVQHSLLQFFWLLKYIFVYTCRLFFIARDAFKIDGEQLPDSGIQNS